MAAVVTSAATAAHGGGGAATVLPDPWFTQTSADLEATLVLRPQCGLVDEDPAGLPVLLQEALAVVVIAGVDGVARGVAVAHDDHGVADAGKGLCRHVPAPLHVVVVVRV